MNFYYFQPRLAIFIFQNIFIRIEFAVFQTEVRFHLFFWCLIFAEIFVILS